MQRQRLALHAALVEQADQPVGEVQRGGRRGDRAFLLREHRLIILAVRLVGAALAGDIGRQRHRPRALEQQLDRLVTVERQQDRPGGIALDGARRHAVPEIDHVAVAHALGVAHEGPPVARPFPLVQRRTDARLAALAFQLGGNDARVVEHQHVTGLKQRGKV